MAEVNIYLKDPAYPELQQAVPLPAADPSLPFQVEGFSPGLYPLESPLGRAGNCWATVASGIHDFREHRNAGPIRWARTSELIIRPSAGKMWNAYYDRKRLNYFFNWDEIRQETLYASGSPSIVLHELGHALLDAVRPDLWRYSSMFEVWALHEAFGDIFARAALVAHPQVLTRALAQTGNDLGQPNLISGLAEQFGSGILKAPMGQLWSLREATQFLAYTDPALLPTKGGRDELIQEVHSFSRVFSGAIYAFFVGLHRTMMAALPPLEAAQQAMLTAIHYVIATTEYFAVRADFFDSFARCMLFVDYQAGAKHAALLQSIFSEWKITHDVKVLEAAPPPFGPSRVSGNPQIGQLEITPSRGVMRVSQEPGLRAMAYNPLYELEVDVANDRHREFDQHGNLALDDYANHQSTLDSVTLTLDFLHRENLVGTEDAQPFGVQGKKLIRKHFACC